jgi:hypothetical protein
MGFFGSLFGKKIDESDVNVFASILVCKLTLRKSFGQIPVYTVQTEIPTALKILPIIEIPERCWNDPLILGYVCGGPGRLASEYFKPGDQRHIEFTDRVLEPTFGDVAAMILKRTVVDYHVSSNTSSQLIIDGINKFIADVQSVTTDISKRINIAEARHEFKIQYD